MDFAQFDRQARASTDGLLCPVTLARLLENAQVIQTAGKSCLRGLTAKPKVGSGRCTTRSKQGLFSGLPPPIQEGRFLRRA